MKIKTVFNFMYDINYMVVDFFRKFFIFSFATFTHTLVNKTEKPVNTKKNCYI